MSDIPIVRSYQSILAGMVSNFTSRTGITNLAVGSPVLSLLESAARSDLRDSMTVMGLLNSTNLDNCTGLALLRKGTEAGVPKITTSPATGKVNINDASFSKLSSQLYQGSSSPIVGAVTINVTDASLFPNSGAVYIGRNTNSYEGPISYTSKVNNTNYWTLNLSTPITKFHNVTETVTVAQGGNRTVGSDVVVRTPQGNLSTAISFNVLYPVTILDGEVEIDNVDIIAQSSGTGGNVGAGTITQFVSLPFTGATVTNPSPLTTGLDTESDDDYRARIRDSLASRTRGTSLAITTAVVGIKSPDENKTLSASSLVKRKGLPTTLYIDDGTGYEEITTGSGIETLVSQANGGEQFFETSNRSIAKAFIVSVNAAPFALADDMQLNVKVGGVTTTHTFSANDFIEISNASAYEVCSSINANSNLLFNARTLNSGQNVILFAKAETNEDIEVIAAVGNDANAILEFSTGVSYTTQLYKNDIRLNKDGKTAQLIANSIGTWNTMSGSQTLTISVDGTPAQTYTFTDTDFINGATGFNSLGINDIAAWIIVLNAKIPGITAFEDNGLLIIESNAGASIRSALSITGGSLTTTRMFNIAANVGFGSDYTLDRNLGDIQLTTPLALNDTLSLGSANTRAFIQSLTIPTTTLAATARFWLQTDGNGTIITSGITPTSSLVITIDSIHEWGHILRVTGPANSFNNVLPGDWVIFWDDAFDASLRDAFRVVNCASTYILVERRLAMTARGGHRSVAMLPVSTNISRVFNCGGHVKSLESLGYTLSAGNNKIGATAACDIFDPNTNSSTVAASMTTPRMYHTAVTLASGKIYVTGGMDDAGNFLTSTELYDPTADTWTVKQPLTTGVVHHRAIKLQDGTVLVCGGTIDGTGTATGLSYRYDPIADTLTSVSSMNTARGFFGAALLPSGKVLAAGGVLTSGSPTTASETFSPGTNTWTASAGNMTVAKAGNAIGLLGTSPTQAITFGNLPSATHSNSQVYELYSISGDNWPTNSNTGGTQFKNTTAATTQDGNNYGFHGSFTSGVEVANNLKWDSTATISSLGFNSVYQEAAPKYDIRAVVLYNTAATYLNHVVITGGTQVVKTNGSIDPTASIELFDGNTGTFSTPDNAVGTVVPSEGGVTFIRTLGRLQELTLPAASNYTASSIVAALNLETDSALASVYQTSKLRINTNSYGLSGSLALAAQNVTASVIGLTPGSAIDNITGHIGSVESSGSAIALPSFQSLEVRGSAKPGANAANALIINNPIVDPSYTLVGLKNWFSGPTTAVYNRFGNNYGYRSTLAASASQTNISKVDVRTNEIEPASPYDRVYAAAPFAIGPNDNLVVTVDNDVNKEFNVKMARVLQTVGSTYAQTSSFRDVGNVTLSKTFGLNYNWNDFAVYMKARALLFSGSSTEAMLARYFRFGSEGNQARLRFSNALAANTSVSIAVDSDTNTTTDIRIYLAGGAPRSPVLRTSTNIGQTCTSQTNGIGTLVYVLNLPVTSATRTSNVTTLTLGLPSGVTDHGLAVNNTIWLQSTSGAFTTNAYLITARTATTVSYADVNSNFGPVSNIGTVSFDPQGQATLTGSGTVVGDFFNFKSTNTAPFFNNTFYITTVNPGSIMVTSGEATGFTPSSTLVWNLVGPVSSNFSIFANPSQTASIIVPAVNALGNKSPITLTLLGDGTGTIVQSSTESNASATFWYLLSDGINWVRSTINPVNTSQDYQFTFKNTINSSLLVNSDWANEVIYICPITIDNIVEWMNTPAVTGLFTRATVDASSDGTKLQIASLSAGSLNGVQVQGGSGNLSTAVVIGSMRNPGGSLSLNTIKASDGAGLTGGMWCNIQNALPAAKAGIFDSTYSLVSLDSTGLMVFNNPIFTPSLPPTEPVKLMFEKQGDYVAISDFGDNSGLSFASLQIGHTIRIYKTASPSSPPFTQTSSNNLGLFKIVRVQSSVNSTDESVGTIWIQNPSAVEETSECAIAGYPAQAILPGDTINIGTLLWGADNQGQWTVVSVGTTTATSNDPFTNNTNIVLSTANKIPTSVGSTAALGADVNKVSVIEGSPSSFLMKIVSIAPNQTDGTFLDVTWDQQVLNSTISASVGSIINVQNKLGFSTNFVSGADGYSYDVGLIREANKVLYGDQNDPATYPGVISDGSNVNISGPLVKRIQVTLGIRVRSPANESDVANRVRSAVASLINRSPVGQPIAIADIISAAQAVVGVTAVTFISPIYGIGNDEININPSEKPFVLDIVNDVGVVFTGS